MSTRGAYGFIIDGQEKIAFNHWDSYLSGLGVDVFKFIKSKSIKKLKEIALNIQLVDDSTKPTKAQIKDCLSKITSDYPDEIKKSKRWSELLSECKIESYDNGLKYMLDNHDFLIDSLFCEWAYIINLDTKVLEIYQGFNNGRNKNGRYAKKIAKKNTNSIYGDIYYGVGLIVDIPLNVLKKMSVNEFLDHINKFVPRED